ncbi:DUF2892 domain-containing protein [Flavobacterium silvisoli]|uniref:DUF2892 domain-containing protein n=1 Tax=Flavobacterium silvisoli TaxID=2529433 RepID=A0A4Q9Z0Y5_9FLAO|nr:DUF2892 domain-containing protein [Flavobacterium silvisoli]TBX69949.1 DUF2892 domain-containing protein [Flavobacterium silvisoli]
MKKNMGSLDKKIRVALAAVLILLYFTDMITGTFGILALIVATLFVLTSLVSFCPLYTFLGIKTLNKH